MTRNSPLRTGTPASGTDDRAQRLRERWGKAISSQRQLVGLTQQELADELGVTQQAVAYWESGKAAPRPHLQVEIAKVLRTAWNVLFQVEAA